jgi:hypothetical protein
MHKLSYLIFFLFGIWFTFLFACKSDYTDPGYTILDIESVIKGKSSPLPNLLIKSVIPLETSDLSLIGEITRLEFFDDRYFILDRS